ncbi:MAG: 50S ribosomal protein L35, partial [Terrimicrobiaceae bacterium]
RAGRRHLLECKSSKSKRKLGKAAVVKDSDVARVMACLPFG